MMKFGKLFISLICVVVSVVMITQLYGCGTLIYPERRNQTTGNIDVGVTLLDGLWLLVFIIPGVVALAVDFTTGAIYLPGGTKRASTQGEMVVVKVNPSELNEKTIKEIVMEQTGCPGFDMREAKVYPLERSENVEKKLAEIAHSGYQAY